MWLRKGIRTECEAILGPTLLSPSCPYLPSPADRWMSSTLSRAGGEGGSPTWASRGGLSVPICPHLLAPWQAKEKTYGTASVKLLQSKGQVRAASDHPAFILDPLSLPWRGLSNAPLCVGTVGTVSSGLRLQGVELLGEAPPTHMASVYLPFKPRFLCFLRVGPWVSLYLWRGLLGVFLLSPGSWPLILHGPPLLPTPDAWDALSSFQSNSAHLPFLINVGKLRPKEWKEARCSSVEWCSQNSNGGDGGSGGGCWLRPPGPVASGHKLQSLVGTVPPVPRPCRAIVCLQTSGTCTEGPEWLPGQGNYGWHMYLSEVMYTSSSCPSSGQPTLIFL